MTKQERKKELRSKYIAAICYCGFVILGAIPMEMRIHNDIEEIEVKKNEVMAAQEQRTSIEQIDKQITGAGAARTLNEYLVNAKPLEVMVIPLPEPKMIDQGELELLARLLHAEVGCVKDDECLYYCGSVVMNRVTADDFPDTIKEVIYQSNPDIQYACTIDGNIEQQPTEREYEIAEDILRNGSYIPEDVIYQSEFKQGSRVYKVFENVYFCYR